MKCLYCGGTVIVREAIQAAAAASIPNLLKLARTAANSLNHQEAYDYFSRVLELDGENRAAWVGKGEAAGWLSHQTSRLPEMINCFHNAIDGATDKTCAELKEQIAGATCKITDQIYTNMKAGLSVAESETWRLYIEGLGNLIKTLESAHNLVPDSVMILRSLIFLCEDNSGRVSYINRRTGQRNWRALPTDWNTFISQRRDYFLKKLYTLDPVAIPIKTKSGLLERFLPGISDALTRSQWAIVGGGILLVVLVMIVGEIERASQGPTQNRPSPPSQDHNNRSHKVNTVPLPSVTRNKPWQDPNVACQYLTSVGMRTKPYQDYGGQSWCMASLFYAEDTPVPNEISYTATGDTLRVQQLELIAETYNFLPAEDGKTLEKASEMAERLLRVAIGEAFPRAPVEAFRKRTPGIWAHGNITIEVVRDEHKPGRGFTITLRIK